MWVTNDPEMARELCAIDARHDAARRAARGLMLTDMVAALRAAKRERQAAIDALASRMRQERTGQ